MVKLTRKLLLEVFGIVQIPHCVTILLWTLGIMTMSGLTFKDLFPIVRDYYDDIENTQVQIKVRRPDEQFRAPDLYLCIPLTGFFHAFSFSEKLVGYLEHGKECPICEGMVNHSFDIWNRHVNGTMSPPDAIRLSDNALAKGFVERVLELENDTDRNGFYLDSDFWPAKDNGINKGNLTWNRPVIAALVDYMKDMSLVEKYLLRRLRFQDVAHSPLDFVDPTFSKESMDVLYSTFTTFVCEFILVINGTTRTDQNVCSDFFRNASHVLSGESLAPIFCMRLPLDYVEDLQIYMHSSYFEGYIQRRKKFSIMTENPAYPPKMDALPPSNMYVSPESKLINLTSLEEVTIVYSLQSNVVEARPQKKKTCYNESSKSECERNCYLDHLESICKCRSYMYRRRSLSREDGNLELPDLKYCSDQDFHDCDQQTWNYTWHDICADRCMDACQSAAYQWQVSSTSVSNSTAEALKLSIQIRRQSYLEFTMKVKDSAEDLISQIGGVFTFYLGGSGLSIVFFLVYLFDSAQRWLQMRQKGDVDRRSNPPKAAWRWNRSTVAIITSNRLTDETRLGEESFCSKQDHEALKNTIGEKFETMEKNNELIMEHLVALNTAVRHLQDNRRKSIRDGQRF